MRILTYRDGVAVDSIVAPEGATISADGRRLSWQETIPERTVVIPATTRVVPDADGNPVAEMVAATTETIPAETIADGLDAPEGAVFVAAPGGGIGWHLDADGVPCPPIITLDQLRAAKLAEMRSACVASIVGGFASSALGSPHTYPSKVPEDQINLMGSVAASLLPDLPPGWSTPFWCADPDGVWAYRPHTAAQIQQAGADGKAWVVTCQTALDTLSTAVAAAVDADALAAIAWTV